MGEARLYRVQYTTNNGVYKNKSTHVVATSIEDVMNKMHVFSDIKNIWDINHIARVDMITESAGEICADISK